MKKSKKPPMQVGGFLFENRRAKCGRGVCSNTENGAYGFCAIGAFWERISLTFRPQLWYNNFA